MSAEFTKRSSVSRTNFAKLHQKDDADIDYQDIPKTDAKFWEDAEVAMPKHKIHLSVRLDVQSNFSPVLWRLQAYFQNNFRRLQLI